MAIKEAGVSAVSVGALLAQKLRIPEYQRPYRWQPETALQLVDDLRQAQARDEDVPYVLGAVILHECDGWLDVVDGQQRLLTLRMVMAVLQCHNLLPDRQNKAPVCLVWQALQHRLAALEDAEKESLLNFISNRCQLVRVVTDDVDEAFRVFDSQNYRGKPLAPHDLLKAYHLREMRNESAAMQTAVVEAWESTPDKTLHRLFATFLYRIARWSRGESAPGFSIHDIGMFKGIAPAAHARALMPCERYHLAAQTAMPLLTSWLAPVTLHDHDAARSRFQLDAPLIAGQPFFEMVSFLLKELEWVEQQAAERVGRFGSSQGRYRYTHELFTAALLYYTNKFGSAGLPQARDKLFAWAYALRVEMIRVQFASIDNRARGKDNPASSPFVLMRNTITAQAIQRLAVVQPKSERAEHEKELLALIQPLCTP